MAGCGEISELCDGVIATGTAVVVAAMVWWRLTG